MSGGLRQTIPTYKRSLTKRIKEAEPLLNQAIPTTIDEREQLIENITAQQKTITSASEKLMAIDQHWIQYMSTLDETEAKSEYTLYAQNASDEQQGYHVLIERAEEISAKLESRAKRLEKTCNISSVPPTASTASAVPASSGSVVNLPKLNLPEFDGDILKFPEFWSLYNATVHSRTDLAPMTKLAYLIPQLTGVAARAVQGYPKTDEYYDLIVKRLRERFEHTDDRFTSMLHAELKRIPSCSPKIDDKRRTLDACERIFRQLEQCGEELDPGKSLVFDLLAKFPHGMIKELERHYKVGVYSTLSSVRKTLEKCISEEEMTAGFLRDLSVMKQQQEPARDQRKISQNHGSNRNHESQQYFNKGYTNYERPHESTLAANARKSQFNEGNFRSSRQSISPCYFCGQNHLNDDCPAYPSAKARLRRLKQLGRCVRCMINHGNERCHRRLYCRQCNTDTHRSTLCYVLYPDRNNNDQSQPHRKFKNSEFHRKTQVATAQAEGISKGPSRDQLTESLTATDVTNFSHCCSKNSLFQTAKVITRNMVTGEECKLRICLDTLSNRTYITEKAARMLNLPSEGEDKLRVAVFGTTKDVDVVSQIVSFGLKQTNGKVIQLEANTTRMISKSSILPKTWPSKEEKIIQSLQCNLADDPFDPNKCIDILVGADYTWDIIQGPRADISGCDLFLIPSVFGFMLGGRLHYETSNSDPDTETTMFCLTESLSSYPSELGMISVETKHQTAYPDVNEFWSLESMGIKDSPEENEDEQAMEIFNKTVVYEKGRYHGKLPWIPERKALLPSNYDVALRRFRSLTSRFQSDPELYQEYIKTMKLQAERGIIEKVPKEQIETDNVVHYLAHHPVIKRSSATTKFRVVYDASAKQRKESPSLNECLLRGPVLLPDLCQILIRFRLKPTVIVSDVEKAFLQVGVQLEDRDVTRFLWYEDETSPNADPKNIAVWRFARVVFGIISSPFMLGATISHHLDNEGTDFAKQLKSDIYVDNIISGLSEDQDSFEYYTKIKAIFERAGMNVQEFCSNSQQLMQNLPSEDRMKNADTKVLGMKWDSAKDDTIRIARSSKFETVDELTKRKVLQAIAAVFDPLGLFQPVTFPAKLFLQKLWFEGESWDSPLNEMLTREWDKLRESLHDLFEIRLPRYVGEANASSNLVVFSDASGKGYGAAVYLRTKLTDGQWSSNLIFAKSRLAPHQLRTSKARKRTKEKSRTLLVSLPRLELLGVVIATATASFCREAMQSVLPVTVFTDSECVLHWIKANKPLKRFVNRRIEQIQATPNAEFRYVNTCENPADLLTRGCTSEDLSHSLLWWHGPSWLNKSSEAWPEARIPPISAEVIQEFKSVQTVVHTFSAIDKEAEIKLLGISLNRYSKLICLLRAVWQHLRFLKLILWNKQSASSEQKWPNVHRIFSQISTDHFQPSDHQAVLKMWIRAVQSVAFGDEIEALRHQRNKKPSLIQQLNLRIDDENLLRACGRMQNADLPESTRSPVLLPKQNLFTELVIQDVHAKAKHVGPTHTLSEFRRLYWVASGRRYVTYVVRKCPLCRRFRFIQEFMLPPMPPWPIERVSRSAPFQCVGVDYFGHLKVKIRAADEESSKMWVCIYTCLSTRAVHLEPVTDCTPSEFYQCLKRFIARRGCPQQIISDNAAYFQLVKILADRSWKEVPQDEDLITYLAQYGIEWKFIVALAPWQGGHYERLIGVVKSVLKTAIGRRLLSWTDLITLLAETEAIVNSRPITYVNSEVDCTFKVLRPVDFLLYRPVTSPPPSATDFPIKDLGEGGKHLSALWKSREIYLQKLWNVWYDEYLQNLRERQNIFHRGGRKRIDRIPNEGEVVIVRDDGLPRGSWKLARVFKLIRSADSKVRAAEILLASDQKANKDIHAIVPPVKVSRAINLLIPLELNNAQNTTTELETSESTTEQTEQEHEKGTEDSNDISNEPASSNDLADEMYDSDDENFFGFSQEDMLHTERLLGLYRELDTQQ